MANTQKIIPKVNEARDMCGSANLPTSTGGVNGDSTMMENTDDLHNPQARPKEMKLRFYPREDRLFLVQSL